MKLSPGIVAMALFVLFWNGLAGTAEVAIGRALLSQRDAAERFVPAEAVVLVSSVKKWRSGDIATYEPRVRYRYEIDGDSFESDRYAFLVLGNPDRALADELRGECVVGEVVTVFVDPEDPNSAVVSTTASLFPASVILLLVPFQSVGIVLLNLLIGLIRQSRFDDKVRAKYVRVDTPDHLVLGRPMMAALGMFAQAMTFLSMAGAGAVVFLFGTGASATMVSVTVGVCVALSSAITWRRRSRGKRPENFMHIDRRIRTFAFPADAPGAPIDSIRSILVEPRPTGWVINGVAQVDHRFKVETDDGVQGLFQVRAGEEEGDQVLDLLRSELM